MKKGIVLLTAFFLLASHAFAGDLEIKLLLQGDAFIQGEPIIVTGRIENKADRPVKLAYGMENGFQWTIAFKRVGGGPIVCPPLRTLRDSKPFHTVKEIPPDGIEWKHETIQTRCPKGVELGEYIVYFQISATKPFLERDSRGNAIGGEIAAWSGELAAEKRITISEPQGIDREAYEHFEGYPLSHQDDLLNLYPTSVYSAYVLAKKIPDYLSPLVKPVPPAEQVMASRDEGKTVLAFPNQDFEQYFQRLDTFMKGGKVPEGLRAPLCGFYGDLLVQRGRFTEAEEAFREALKAEPLDSKGCAFYDRSRAFLEALRPEKKESGAVARPGRPNDPETVDSHGREGLNP